MKKLLTISGMLIALAAPVVADAHPIAQAQALNAMRAVPQSSESVIFVPAGTPVPVHVVGVVSSNNMKEGERFEIQAARDVVVNGMIVVREGSLGSGTIGSVDHVGGNGHSGALTLIFEWMYAADGGKVRLAQAVQRQAEDDRKGASSTATIVGFATFGIGGLFGHNLARGRDVTVDDRKILDAFVADNVHVTAVESAATDHFDR